MAGEEMPLPLENVSRLRLRRWSRRRPTEAPVNSVTPANAAAAIAVLFLLASQAMK
jgi:hypothetical protein